MRLIHDKDGKCWQVTELINLADPNVKTLQLKCENGQILDVGGPLSDEQLVYITNATRPGQPDTISDEQLTQFFKSTLSDEQFAEFMKFKESQQSKP